MRKLFRNEIKSALANLPFQTPEGQVIRDDVRVSLGYPGGTHELPPLWLYQRKNTDLEMLFGFYSNFTEDDLICKVVNHSEVIKPGEGASVQFNGDRCIRPEGQNALLEHDGRITVGKPVARKTLLDLISSVCPKEMALAGIKGDWPVRIGATNDVSDLIDHLFLYCYCIEQGKRQIKNTELLPLLLA